MEHASSDRRGVSTQKTDVQSAPDPLRDLAQAKEEWTPDHLRALGTTVRMQAWPIADQVKAALDSAAKEIEALSVDRRERVIAPQLDSMDSGAGFIHQVASPLAETEPRPDRTIHGGNIGGDGIPFYLQPGQRGPEYDQGDSVVVWYDDLYDLDQRARKVGGQSKQDDMCHCGHYRDWHFYGEQDCFARGGQCQCARFDLRGSPPVARVIAPQLENEDLGADAASHGASCPTCGVAAGTVDMLRDVSAKLYEAERVILSKRCTECAYTFSPNELLAEDPTAWGHPCHQPNLPPGTPCESYREFLRCVDPPVARVIAPGEQEQEEEDHARHDQPRVNSTADLRGEVSGGSMDLIGRTPDWRENAFAGRQEHHQTAGAPADDNALDSVCRFYPQRWFGDSQSITWRQVIEAFDGLHAELEANRQGNANGERLCRELKGTLQQAHAYLSRLLKHYAPQCEPLPSLMGVVTQIDNLLVGSHGNQVLSEASPSTQSEALKAHSQIDPPDAQEK